MGSTNKPIVFVFGAKKGDADGRKKNLSAINTQVAYRAHERRREKKNRQRVAKEDGKVDQRALLDGSSTTATVVELSSATNVNTNVDFNHYVPPEQTQPRATSKTVPKVDTLQIALPPFAEATQHIVPPNRKVPRRPQTERRGSDLTSNVSSEQDGVWSLSPSSSNRYSTPSTDVSSVSPASAPLQASSYFDRGLDPFFRLPSIASDREKWLVHFYFREMGHIGFGTHQNSLFCPDRDWVSQYVSSKPLCFQWILIFAEEQLGRMGVLPNQTATIERKARAYRDLGTILEPRSHTHTSSPEKLLDPDEGISGIMYAAIIDQSQTSMHLMALDRYINSTGGLEGFLERPLGIVHPEHLATVYAFGKCPIPTIPDLEAILTRFTLTLHTLHNRAKAEQEEKRRIRNRRPWDPLSRQVIDGNGVLVPSSHDEHFRYYIKAQQDCLTSDSIAPLLNTSLNETADWTAQARHLATLVQTSLILAEFADNYLASAMFLKRLKYVADMSTARDPRTGVAHLSHAGLLLINAFVRQEVQTHFDRTKSLTKGVRISQQVVDALKVFGLLKQPTRTMVVGWLRDWLCYNEHFEDVDFAHLHDHHLRGIEAEVRNVWMAGATKI